MHHRVVRNAHNRFVRRGMRMTVVMFIYGALAVLGAVVPWYFNVQFFSGAEAYYLFVQKLFANPAVSSISTDIMIACTAFLVWMTAEARRLKMRHWWIFILMTFTVAFACAFPLFLLVREYKIKNATVS